ncbi:acyltransferase family protein [Larkinella soli]|uniref:acyltransferase family protein n=1 Tax=Larkinella soli TaxID=1770527 RepID=UPI000FFB930F|nr:acyltransferase [Larkinella soli]
METTLPIRMENPPESSVKTGVSKERFSRLDVLRALAIATVFGFHFMGSLSGWDHLYAWQGNWRTFAPTPASYIMYPVTLGWSGVSLFFIISGFVIHYSFLKSERFQLRSFYWRRLWKIYPAYLAALLFFCWYTKLDIQSREGAIQLVTHLLFLHNFHEDTFFGVNGSFWSLATEVQFYLLYPLFLSMRRQIGLNGSLLAALALSLFCRLTLLAFRECSYVISAEWTFPGILWFDWILGAFLAERFFDGKPAFRASRFLLPALIAFFVLSSLYKPAYAFSFSLASLVSALLVDRYIQRKAPLSRWEAALIPVGLCSYSFYLWHHPLINTFLYHHRHTDLIPETPLWNVTLVPAGIFLLVLVWSRIMYHVFEKPSVMLSRRTARWFHLSA